MHTNINRSVKHALLLRVDDIKLLWDLLADHYDDLKATISCVDGSELHTTTFAELDQYENPTFRKISELKLRCGDYFGPTCNVTIGEKLFATASLTISDDPDDKRALKVADEFAKRMKECRPYYWLISYLKPTLVLWLLCVLWSTVQAWRAFIQSGGMLPTSNVDIVTTLYILVPFLVLVIVVGVYLDRGWSWLFPKLWFDVGRQAQAYQRRVSVRHWVFGVIILSVVLSIIANLITNFIT